MSSFIAPGEGPYPAVPCGAKVPAAFAGGAIIGALGGAEFRLPLLTGAFRFAALQAVILQQGHQSSLELGGARSATCPYANAVIRRAKEGDVGQLGLIGPAAYAEAHGYLWDKPDTYACYLATFSADAFANLLANPNAGLWIAELGARVVGFLLIGP
jgi:hypothetical protein